MNSVDDLVNQTEIEYGMLVSGRVKNFFQESKHPVYSKLYKQMSRNKISFVSSIEQGVEMVRNSNGKYAFFVESNAIDYINSRYN